MFSPKTPFTVAMGELIVVGDWNGARPRTPEFIYDLACPLSYLAAERVEHSLGQVEWVPAIVADLGPRTASDRSLARAEAMRTALSLHLPLVWPERHPSPVRRASRAAAHAAAAGFGARLGLAALRLAFCGGFDLDERDVLAEAAAAAGICVAECLEAAENPALDGVLGQTAAKLRRDRVARLPAIRMGRTVFGGIQAAAQATALLRSPA